MSGRTVALATCAALPNLADDEPLLLDALRALGVEAEPVVWDDPAIDWDGYDLVVVRSTWDYAPRRDAFLAWAERLPQLLNPPEVLRWNTDKRYLAGLPHAVATHFVIPGEGWQPPTEGDYVVKPAVSAGSRDTARYAQRDAELARAHVAALQQAGRTVMVQPYLTAVDDHGETALIYFAGEYSHAIRKGQMLHAGRRPSQTLYLEEDIAARLPDERERAIAEEVLEALPWARHDLLYARVDLIPGPDGAPQLVELELTEPSLFFSHGAGAADRLARAIVERLS